MVPEGEDVCKKCGIVGESVFSTTYETNVAENLSHSQHEKWRFLKLIRDEVTETIMRISGGDCTGVHVDAIMNKLSTWHGESCGDMRAHIMRIGMPHHDLSRGFLAVAVQLGLLENGRHETMDHIAGICGATMRSVQYAEKCLRVSRTYLQSPVLLRKIVDTLTGLDKAWHEAILSLANASVAVSFRDPDVVVASVALALGRRVREDMKNSDAKMSKYQFALLRRQLRLVSGAALCRTFGLIYGTVNRASRDLGVLCTREVNRWSSTLVNV